MVYEKEQGKYYKDDPETKRKENNLQMYVNGKYISKSHPLHKPGRYKTFEDWPTRRCSSTLHLLGQ